MNTLAKRVQAGHADTQEALEIFDALEPVSLAFMKGRWHGAGFLTGHPLDGMLETFDWYGKEFVDENRVHPLIFRGTAGSLYTVHPGRLPLTLGLRLPMPKGTWMKYLFLALKPLLATRQYRARLRMIEYRGRSSAAMIYDDLPIIDLFRKVDEDTLLGIMDLRGIDTPFFFRLMRDRRD